MAARLAHNQKVGGSNPPCARFYSPPFFKQGERPSGKPGGFSVEADMEKSKKNKLKDYKRTKDKIWVDKPTSINKRTSGSGVVFRGKYVEKRGGG